MSIVAMSKIKLVGLINNREKIMETLFSCGCVELSETESLENMHTVSDEERLLFYSENFDRCKKVIDYIENASNVYKTKSFVKEAPLSKFKNFFVSEKEFLSVKRKAEHILENLSSFEENIKNISENNSEIIKLNNLIEQLTPYRCVPYKFSDLIDSDNLRCYFGLIKTEELDDLERYCENAEFITLEVFGEGDTVVAIVYAHRILENEVTEKLNDLGFIKCSFDFNLTPVDKISAIKNDITLLEQGIDNELKDIFSKAYQIRDLKILCDFYKIEIEKCNGENEFLYTDQTFLLEGFIPTEKIETVKKEIEKIGDAVYLDFSLPGKDEVIPTLVKNKPIVRQTEFITDLYSTPNYREMDPSKVVFFFFMLFMGIIMADVGYGFLMIVIGLFLAKRIKVDNGTRRLWYIIMMGGFSTIIFGLLFNSFFGVSLLSSSVLPNPVPSQESGGDMTGLMIILLGCLGIGVVQISVGYACKAINSFKNKDVLGGLFEGINWVIFFIGLVFASLPLLFGMLIPKGIEGVMSKGASDFFKSMQTPGLIVVIVTVAIAAVTAGRNEKGFGKFTKGFGAVYGLISLMSDILSYARLFGLMLSGMIIAQTFNSMGVDLFNGGGVGIVLGPLVIVIGHTFNIAMNVLGAYIHDSRLQYIEFFGKFYTGEGKKFTPFGSKTDYIYLIK